MSMHYESSYALEEKRRRQIYLNRVASTTEEFCNRYNQQFIEMNNKGFCSYIPSEMNRLEADLARIRELISTNPEEARNISFEVGSYIRSMTSLATEAKEQFERAEQMRLEHLRIEKEKKQSELIEQYFTILKTITNPIVINYSIADMQKLSKDIENGKINSKSELQRLAENIKNNAEKKAIEWKDTTIRKNKKQEIEVAIKETEERVKSQIIEDKEQNQNFLNKISNLKVSLEKESDNIDSIEKQINELEVNIDDTLISEDVRRETVKVIIKQLRSQEFTVETPQMVNDDGKNYVKIVAKRPSGKTAFCKIDMFGKMEYKFDNYEGMTCLKDIERFNVDLEKIYSIKLSNERIKWQNPDKLSLDALNLPKNNVRKL